MAKPLSAEGTDAAKIDETIKLGEREFKISLDPITENNGVKLEISADVRIGDFILVEIDSLRS